jgi:hypothetical protein
LSKSELAEKLLNLADTADNGKPKTGRRYYYLALSYGYVSPDMGDTEAAKKSRDAAYNRVTDVLGVLRMDGRLPWRMVLDLTRELDEPLVYDSPRGARRHMRSFYDEDRWARKGHIRTHRRQLRLGGTRLGDARVSASRLNSTAARRNGRRTNQPSCHAAIQYSIRPAQIRYLLLGNRASMPTVSNSIMGELLEFMLAVEAAMKAQ